MNLGQHGDSSASKVICNRYVVKHVLDVAVMHVLSIPCGKQKRHPGAMKYIPNHIPPPMIAKKVALRQALGSLLIALGVGS